MPGFRSGPRMPRMPRGPRMPKSPSQKFFQRVNNPLYPLTQDFRDEQEHRAKIAAAVKMRQLEEENRLRAAGYSDKTFLCERCGNPFIFSMKDQAFFASKGFSPPKYCSKTCRESAKAEREQVMREKERIREERQQEEIGQAITITCIDCKRAFSFSKGEQEFFRSKGFSNPVRCPGCRAKRKGK